ncbi:DUF4352 domain-containing protein, partial [Candidatus Micrarchaeota archaeon]|nr:DUF4352 domain-containing protein [Candidatus Micrarchaeota archaeon]
MNYKVIFGILILGLIFFSGCTNNETQTDTTQEHMTIVESENVQTQEETNTSTENQQEEPQSIKQKPISINNFNMVKEEDGTYRVYFIFDNGKAYSGKVNLKIYDEYDNLLHESNYEVKESDYVDYQFSLTGKDIGKATEIWLDPLDIKKAMSNTGVLIMTFEFMDGTKITAEANTYSVESYTEEEMNEIREQAYLEHVNEVNLIQTKSSSSGDFQVSLVGYGDYTHLEHSTWGDEVTEFRVDIIIKNVGDEKGSFFTYNAAIVDDLGNQYETTFSSSDCKIKSGEVYPGVTKSGCLLFDRIDESAS